MSCASRPSPPTTPRLGELVGKLINQVGKDGVVTVEESKGTETTTDTVEGLQFDKGYLSPYFVTDATRMETIYEEPQILFFEKKIASVQDLVPLLEKVLKTGRPFVIVAEDLENEALATLVLNRIRGNLPIVAVKAPGFGDRRKAMLEDMAILTGGQFVSDDLGIKLENVTTDMLGSCQRIVITKENTTIVGGRGDPRRDRGSPQAESSRRSRPRTRPTTRRSCRSARPSSAAASPS